jgi:hypothetical protein
MLRLFLAYMLVASWTPDQMTLPDMSKFDVCTSVSIY